MSNNITIIPLSWLKPHKNIDTTHLEKLYNHCCATGIQSIPLIIVDKATYIIIDGHHRFHLYKKLGMTEVAVLYVENYIENKNIIVNSQIKITKKDVINMGLSGECYPYKTTQHLVRINDVYYPICKLYDL